MQNEVKQLEFKRADCNAFQKKEINRITEEIADIRSKMPTDEDIEKEKQELQNEKQPIIDEIESSIKELRKQRDSIKNEIEKIREELNRDR